MDRDGIAELFSAYGPVSVKRMFSGFGLYAEEVCFCLVLRGGEFYLKADETTFPRFEAENCRPFSYTQPSTGKVVSVNSFWRMPERLYDDPEELAEWARQAVATAHRAQIAKSRRAKVVKNRGRRTTPSKAARGVRPAAGPAAKRGTKGKSQAT